MSEEEKKEEIIPPKEKNQKEKHPLWILMILINQGFFFLLTVGVVYWTHKEFIATDIKWFYLALSTVLILFFFLITLFLKNKPLYYLTMIIISLNIFVIPLTFLSCNVSLSQAFMSIIVYVSFCIIISPLEVGLIAFVTTLAFCFSVNSFIDLGAVENFMHILIATVFISIISFLWRYLINRILAAKSLYSQVKETSQLDDEITVLQKQKEQLKDEIIKCILAIRQNPLYNKLKEKGNE